MRKHIESKKLHTTLNTGFVNGIMFRRLRGPVHVIIHSAVTRLSALLVLLMSLLLCLQKWPKQTSLHILPNKHK